MKKIICRILFCLIPVIMAFILTIYMYNESRGKSEVTVFKTKVLDKQIEIDKKGENKYYLFFKDKKEDKDKLIKLQCLPSTYYTAIDGRVFSLERIVYSTKNGRREVYYNFSSDF